MNLYDSNIDVEFSKKNEAFYNYYRLYDSNHKKSGKHGSLFEGLINVIYYLKI